jgi:hypothetical protein
MATLARPDAIIATSEILGTSMRGAKSYPGSPDSGRDLAGPVPRYRASRGGIAEH